MSESVPTTLDWISLRDSELRARGRNPAHRIWYTGHTACLQYQWLPSLGRWAAHETDELISKTQPHHAKVHVSHAAYRKYKSRHRLMTRRQFQCIHGPYPWSQAELCFAEHLRARRELGPLEAEIPIGSACAYAVATARTALGILAVEAVIWTRLLSDVLSTYGISMKDWAAFTCDEKSAAWDAEGPAEFDRLLRAPAVAGLPAVLLEAD